MEIVQIDLANKIHCDALITLISHYMLDQMGGGKAIEKTHPPKLLNGLKKQNNYIGFLLFVDKKPAALANCFVGFSTFKAKQLINIHDFVVHSNFRQQGLGQALLETIANYALKNNMCRVSLEVREDNQKAMNLYRKMDFKPCAPNMYFWEKTV